MRRSQPWSPQLENAIVFPNERKERFDSDLQRKCRLVSATPSGWSGALLDEPTLTLS